MYIYIHTYIHTYIHRERKSERLVIRVLPSGETKMLSFSM